MCEDFTPQDTTLDSFQEHERNIFKFLSDHGYDQKVSKTIAHVFTQYALNYLSIDGAVKIISDAGLPQEEAFGFVVQLEKARQEVAKELTDRLESTPATLVGNGTDCASSSP